MEKLRSSMNPKVSIIIPVYNVEKYLERCVDSALNQTYKNLEIILVNDGSTDNSLEICKKYETENRVKIFSEENRGLPVARNLGVKKSSGDYIIFLDSDDWLDDNLIEKLVKNNSEKTLSGCNVKDIFEKKTSLHNRVGKIKKQEFIKEIVSGRKEAFVSGYLFDAKVCKKIEFDETTRYFEDIPYIIKYLKNTEENEITFENNSFYNYFQNQNSITLSGKNIYDKVKDLFKTTANVNAETNGEYETKLISRELTILEALLQHANKIELERIIKDFELPEYCGNSKIIKNFIRLYKKGNISSLLGYYKFRKIGKAVIMKIKK